LNYPANIETKLGFDKIREQTLQHCATQYARDLLARTSFCTSFDGVRKAISQTAEMHAICQYEPNFPDTGFVDVLHFVGKIRVAGGYLIEEEMTFLQQMLATVHRILSFFENAKNSGKQDARRFPELTALALSVEKLPSIAERIAQLIDNSGKMRDNASPTLSQLRGQMQEARHQVSYRIQRALKAAQAAGYTEDSAQVSVRDGRAVIPINTANKRKIAGIVLDESATGKTAFVEPAEVVELNNRLKELGFAERREIVKILQDFADFARPFLPQIEHSAEFLGQIDLLRAKSRIAIQMNAALPVLVREPLIDWYNARHPLLEAALKKDGKTIVPLSLRLTSQQHLLLVSGPNAGGKSVVLKTVGLLQYMAQCGFLVPMGERSEVGIFERIFVDIGDEQSLENDLSTYSSHLINMKYFLRNAHDKTLILIDEFGTGTEPQLGGAIAQAVLQQLVRQKTFGICTTHYANLKQYATDTQGVQSGAMLFDVQKIEPLFQLKVGAAGSSFAFEIAQKIGLPNDVLTTAKSLLGEHHVNFDKTLRNIARDKKYWEEKRERIKNVDKNLEEQLAKYNTALDSLQAERKKILREAKQQAQQLVSEANRQIESTIRGIKEAQAEREQTKQLRAKLQHFAQTLQPEPEPPAASKLPAFEIGSAAQRRSATDFSTQRLNFHAQIDVRGQRVDETLPQIERWLDQALMFGFGTLKILHGTGEGILRQQIRRYLATLSFVQKFYDEHVESGGAGITVIELK
jgi:DNA mismatch repair protein MutS2